MFCILIPTSASTPFILGKSRMRKRARTDLCGGRPVMVVPTATTIGLRKVCLNVKSREERVVLQKAELNGDVDSENNHGGSSIDLCTTSDWMFTRRPSAIA